MNDDSMFSVDSSRGNKPSLNETKTKLILFYLLKQI